MPGLLAHTVLITGQSSPTAIPTPASYWLADIKHQGVAAFNPDPTYQVFSNVKDFGAKGELNKWGNNAFSNNA
jgi:hypothetical protein